MKRHSLWYHIVLYERRSKGLFQGRESGYVEIAKFKTATEMESWCKQNKTDGAWIWPDREENLLINEGIGGQGCVCFVDGEWDLQYMSFGTFFGEEEDDEDQD